MERAIIDTGPLVAAINRRDQWHAWSREQFRTARLPLMTCESVISESWFLLHRTDIGRQVLVDLLERGIIKVMFAAGEHVSRIVEIMRRYADVPMSVADACLVRMTEVYPDSSVITLDGDFRIYRRLRRKPIPLWMPSEL